MDGEVVKEAFALNEPMQAVKGESRLAYDSFVSFDNEQVEVDAVKRSEDGKYFVIRFHEFAGARQEVALKLGCTWKEWAEGDLRERPLTEFTGEEIRMSLHPYEIKTILIKA